jgi:hypothetical protein
VLLCSYNSINSSNADVRNCELNIHCCCAKDTEPVDSFFVEIFLSHVNDGYGHCP